MKFMQINYVVESHRILAEGFELKIDGGSS